MKKAKLVKAGLPRELPSMMASRRLPCGVSSQCHARSVGRHSDAHRRMRQVVREPRGISSIRVWQKHRMRNKAIGDWMQQVFPGHNDQSHTKLFAFGTGARPGANADGRLHGFPATLVPTEVRHMLINIVFSPLTHSSLSLSLLGHAQSSVFTAPLSSVLLS